MATFLIHRLLLMFPMIVGASLVVFSIFHFSKIDPVRRMLGERSQDPAMVAALRADFGLDRPAPVRYIEFISGVFVLDFGRSLMTRRPVREEIAERFPATIELAGTALILSVGYGFLAGLLAAIKRNTAADYISMGIALVAVSMPVFWLGLMLAWLFSEKLGWFPLQGRHSLRYIGAVEQRTGLLLVDSLLSRRWDVFRDAASHLVLPAVTLAAVTSAITARMTRASVLEVLQQDYLRTARAKGVGTLGWLRHLLRNALIPIVTIVGLEIPALLGGSVITETIFAWPGMGKYLIDRILAGDVFAVQGVVMFMTVLFVLVNMIVDASYAVIDPRIRVG